MHRVLRISAALMIVMAMTLVVNMRAVPAARAGTMQTYIVLYKANGVPANAASKITAAGGTLVAAYGEIGVAIARSDNANFGSAMAADSQVEGASSTEGFGMKLDVDSSAAGAPVVNIPATDSDTLSGLQWDMRQIHTPEAHAITGGSPSVLVGDLDTGLDYTHPDLAPNIDFSKSVSCESGAPDPNPAAWDDNQGHGTHTAGTIAAASNGFGIVGVAPNVRIAAVKTSNDDGFFYPHMVICAFMYVGRNHFDVTNNSYFADPYLYNCRNDATQRAVWKAEQRAIRYALSQGVTIVASAGNENDDMAHPSVDNTTPSDGTPVPREVTNACVRIPSEIAGVTTVSANGNLLQKAYYSNYGIGEISVVAPGGDRRFQITANAPNGRVLSTYPAKFYAPSPLIVQDCSVSPCAVYAYLQGTSMAGPHVTGVAALIKSQHPNANPGAVQAMLQQTADAQDCPANPFNPGGTGAFLATCQGGPAYNGFYGHGQVNALSAVTR